MGFVCFVQCQEPDNRHEKSGSGRTYFVAKSGSDDNAGFEESPWLTIQKAADSMRPGDTVYVRKGLYKESVTIKRSGKEGKRITFAAQEGDTVEIKARFCHGFYVDADYITIRGFKISHAYHREGEGSYDWTASGITTHRSYNIFEHNEISDSMYGIMVRLNPEEKVRPSSEGSNVIRYNYIHDTDLAAVRVKRSDHNVIAGNTFERNHLQESVFKDENGKPLFHTEASVVFYVLDGLTLTNNKFREPKYGPLILELDMATRTPKPPSQPPNTEGTRTHKTVNNVTITDNLGFKFKNKNDPIMLALGRDFTLGNGHDINRNGWFNGMPGSKMVEWGYNFWRDNDKDDGITPSVWTLKEFQKHTGFDTDSTDLLPPKPGKLHHDKPFHTD